MKKIRTGDQNLVKQINKSIVFNTIKLKGPISRAQISKETSLNKATVSTMALELINDSFIYEIGSGQSSGGRKPVMLYFNNVVGYSIGIDLGVNYILGVLTDLSGNILEETTSKLTNTEFTYVTNKLISTIEYLIQKSPESTYGVVGIGIGVPGNVNQHEKILFAPNLKWKDVDLKHLIEDKFHIPTEIKNEANAGAHGEQLYGAGKDISNLVYVSIGIGIGAGIIINNHLYTGSTGISGEMGHFTIDANGRKCSCGNRGCWELYASESALLKAAKQEKSFNNFDVINLEDLVKDAQSGNAKVLQLLNTLGEYIGIGITNIINTFNPEVVIIGNRIARFEKWTTNSINRVLDERLSINHRKNTEIRFSILEKNSAALGAASFSITNFLLEKQLQEGAIGTGS